MALTFATMQASKAKLLVVEPDGEVREHLGRMLSDIDPDGFDLDEVAGLQEAVSLTGDRTYDACLIRSASFDSPPFRTLLARSRELDGTPVIVLTESRAAGLAAMQAGAADFVEWAGARRDLLERSIRYVLQKQELSRQAAQLASEQSARLAIETRKFRLEVLSEAAGELLAVDDPVELLGRLYPKLSAHLDLDCYLHYLIVEEDGERLVLRDHSGVPEGMLPQVRELNLASVLADRRPQTASSELDGQQDGGLAQHLGLSACFSYPLMLRGCLVGTLSFGSRRRGRFTSSEVIFLQAICHYLATALERTRLTSELTDRANRLAESEQRFRLMAETVPDFLLSGHADASCDFCNQQFCDYTGLTLSRVSGSGWWDVVHPDDAGRLRRNWPAMCGSGQGAEIELRFRSQSGAYRWFVGRWRAIRGDDGQVSRWIASCADIDDRKRAERVLKQSERQFRAIFETSPDCIVIVDDELRLVKVNPATHAALGLEKLAGRSMTEFVRPAGRIDEMRRALLQTGRYSGEMQIARPDGEVLEFDVGGAFSIMPGRHLLVFHDITERRRMEGQLRESESRFRTLAQAVPQIVWTAEPDGRADFYSDQLTEFSGLSVEQVCEEGWTLLLHPDDLDRSTSTWRRAVQTGEPFEIEQRLLQKDGSYRWFLTRAVPLRNESGRIVKWSGSGTNIHDQKLSEQTLAREHAAVENERRRLRAVLDVLPVAVFITDRNGRVTDVNPAVATTWGRLPVLSPTLRDFAEYYKGFSPKSGKCIATEFRGLYRALHGGESVSGEEMEFTRADGKRGTVLNYAVPIRDAAGQIIGAVAVSVDITDLKRTQRQLIDLNEVLEQRVRERTRSLLTYQEHLRGMTSELVLTEQRERRRLATELHDYLAQLLVASKMKSKLVSHHVKPSGEKLMDDLRGLVDESLKYTRTLIADLSPTILYEAGLFASIHWLGEQMQRHGLTVTIEQQGECMDMPDDKAVMIFQTVRELLFNVVKHAGVDQATIRLEQCNAKELVVTVEDEGVGFDASRQESHPAGGKFGLFSVRERLVALGGFCEIQSTPRQGTRAVVRVPMEPVPVAVDETSSETAAVAIAPTPSKSRPRGSIRVLLVDDHKMVREGFRTLIECDPQIEVAGEAANGEEALEQARLIKPDVVIMDINMPRMNGIEATRRLKQEMPDISIIGLSVHDDRGLTATMLEAGASCYLTKGGQSEELSRAIHATYDAQSRQS